MRAEQKYVVMKELLVCSFEVRKPNVCSLYMFLRTGMGSDSDCVFRGARLLSYRNEHFAHLWQKDDDRYTRLPSGVTCSSHCQVFDHLSLCNSCSTAGREKYQDVLSFGRTCLMSLFAVACCCGNGSLMSLTCTGQQGSSSAAPTVYVYCIYVRNCLV